MSFRTQVSEINTKSLKISLFPNKIILNERLLIFTGITISNQQNRLSMKTTWAEPYLFTKGYGNGFLKDQEIYLGTKPVYL